MLCVYIYKKCILNALLLFNSSLLFIIYVLWRCAECAHARRHACCDQHRQYHHFSRIACPVLLVIRSLVSSLRRRLHRLREGKRFIIIIIIKNNEEEEEHRRAQRRQQTPPPLDKAREKDGCIPLPLPLPSPPLQNYL